MPTVAPRPPRRAGLVAPPAGRRGSPTSTSAAARLAAEDVARCKALVIPPAWTDVWICPAPNGHIQAVGSDEAGRRQYLYHPVWREQRDKAKHDRVLIVARRLPGARRVVGEHLALPGMPKRARPRHGVPAARPRLLPRRRRAVRRGQRQLRPGDHREAARPRRRRRGRVRVPGEVGPGAPGRRRRYGGHRRRRRAAHTARRRPRAARVPGRRALAGPLVDRHQPATSRTSSAARCRRRTSARGTAR